MRYELLHLVSFHRVHMNLTNLIHDFTLVLKKCSVDCRDRTRTKENTQTISLIKKNIFSICPSISFFLVSSSFWFQFLLLLAITCMDDQKEQGTTTPADSGAAQFSCFHQINIDDSKLDEKNQSSLSYINQSTSEALPYFKACFSLPQKYFTGVRCPYFESAAAAPPPLTF